MNGYSTRYANIAPVIPGQVHTAKFEENRVRSFAQSVLTHFFDIPPLPTYKEAVDILAWAKPTV